jgi:hypothetical protein
LAELHTVFAWKLSRITDRKRWLDGMIATVTHLKTTIRFFPLGLHKFLDIS